jgi:hypothetical protein
MEAIATSAWAGGLKVSTARHIVLETSASSVPELTKYLVEHNIGVLSLRAVNSLEAYFLSLTSGNEV